MPNRNLVFVVDDDAMMLKSVARLLRQLGYESVLFPSAEAFANHSDFDEAICVVLDINLGDVSGIDLRQRLKEANISVPIIYMTGNDSPPFVRLRINPDVWRISSSHFRSRLWPRSYGALSTSDCSVSTTGRSQTSSVNLAAAHRRDPPRRWRDFGSVLRTPAGRGLSTVAVYGDVLSRNA